MLETLTPLERAVFVLHEVLGHAHTEIAGILDRSPSAIRQLAHRAREHVHARRPRYQTDPQVRQRVTERFLAAVMGGDLNALMQVLAPGVTVWADGGGKARAAGTHPEHGRDKVARLVISDAFRHPIPDLSIRYRRVNGEPAALLLSGSTPTCWYPSTSSPTATRYAPYTSSPTPTSCPASAERRRCRSATDHGPSGEAPAGRDFSVAGDAYAR